MAVNSSPSPVDPPEHPRQQGTHPAGGDGEAVVSRHQRLSAAVRMAKGVLHEQSDEQVGLAASGAAFWLVISAFPTAIAVMSLFGLVVSPERVANDLGRLANAVPGSLGSLLSDQLRHLAATGHARLSLGLVISLVLAIWSASGGVYNLDRAIRIAYGLPPQTYVEGRGRALAGACVAVILLGASAVAVSFATTQFSVATTILGIPVAILAITAGVAGLYRFSVGTPVAARGLLPGAVASGVGVVIVIAAFGFYVATSSRYTAVYGALAGAVIGMLGIYLVVYVVLLGAVLNMQLSGGKTEPSTRAEAPSSSSGPELDRPGRQPMVRNR